MKTTHLLVLLLVALVAVSSGAVEDPSYALSPWPYGAIAWVGGIPDDVQSVSAMLTDAVSYVFELWHLTPPSRMEGWEDPASVEPAWKTGQSGPIPQVIKKDAASGTLWRLNPLIWEDMDIYPMLYIAFPSRALIAQAFGTVSWGGVWIAGNAAMRGSEVWFQALTGVPMSITAPAVDGAITAVHELAHWMTYLVCVRDNVSMSALPEFIIEGIAKYTEASFLGVSGWKRYAADWVETHHLSVVLDAYDTYTIGLSVVAYLVEVHGHSGFLDTLSQWAVLPEFMISRIESDWKAWLGTL